jgi:hypothetical protein
LRRSRGWLNLGHLRPQHWHDPARKRALLAVAALLLASALYGCTQARDVASSAAYSLNPFGATDLSVNAVSVQGPYLLADVSGRKEQLRLMAPITPACTSVLQPEGRVRYRKSGVFGRVERDGETCDPVGIASLEQWRNRQPRRRSAQMVPRATARFSPLAETETHLLVRGRFPLASRVNIPAGFDLVALLPASDVCRAVVARGQASIEFRPAGRDPFRLLSGSDACVIEGFAMPPV